jgi:TetR/AcrR family transcriptional repressor of nem operon
MALGAFSLLMRIILLVRPRCFDEDKALDAAIACFWRRGYEATSIRDLTGEMGINGPSLYNAFGDKRALFIRALERYAAISMRERIDRLESKHGPAAAICAFFDELIARTVSDTARRGCLLVNTALEVAPHDAEIGALVASYLNDIFAFFHRNLRTAQSVGHVRPQLRCDEAARLLQAAVLGIRVMARINPQRSLLENMAHSALGLLGLRPPSSAEDST